MNSIDVFLSRKSQDAPLARAIYNFLVAKGFKVFDSDHSLLEMGNADYSRSIDDALVRTENLIVIGSSVANISSSWVEAEWRFFLNRKRAGKAGGNLLSVVSEGVKIDDLPASLQNYEVIRFDPNTFDNITAYIKRRQYSADADPMEAPSDQDPLSNPSPVVNADATTPYEKGVELFKKRDYENAANYFIEVARQGNVEAQLKLGYCYWFQESKITNHELARTWFYEAAKQGNIEAEYRLGVFYESGESIIKDDTEAVKWYQKAAQHGYADAQYSLGNHYKDGLGVSQSNDEAMKWYLKAAEQGHGESQYYLARHYRSGDIVTKDYAQAMNWYYKVAHSASFFAEDALHDIGEMHGKGDGFTKDYTQAIKWYLRAAEKNHAKSQFKLSKYYEKGWGVAKNSAESEKWRQKSVENGHFDVFKVFDNLFLNPVMYLFFLGSGVSTDKYYE